VSERVRTWLAERVPPVTTFVLRRLVDGTGVSGVGVVADGAVFPDLRAVTRWRAGNIGVAQTCVWENVAHVRRVHGHNGDTRIELVPYEVLTEMILAALDTAEELEAVGEDGSTVIDAITEVLDKHLAHEAEIDRAARGATS
jgi:hypothetical protein